MDILNLRNYGDFNNIQNDVKTLHDIINRQGTNLVVDCLAESLGNTGLKFNLTDKECIKIMDSIIDEFRTQTFERI